MSIVSSRSLSLLVAAIYLLIALLSPPDKSIRNVLGTVLIMAGGLVLPLACIWFGDELGDYLGALPGPGITKRSPGWMVKIFGWILLLLPAIAGLWFMYTV